MKHTDLANCIIKIVYSFTYFNIDIHLEKLRAIRNISVLPTSTLSCILPLALHALKLSSTFETDVQKELKKTLSEKYFNGANEVETQSGLVDEHAIRVVPIL